MQGFVKYQRKRWFNYPSVWVALLIIGVMLGALAGHHVNSLRASRERQELLEQVDTLRRELEAATYGNFSIDWREV